MEGLNMSAYFTFYRVNCKFNWAIDDDYDTYSFGSLEGAKAWIESKKAELMWCSIEGLEARPCNEGNPGGQLFYGMIYHDFIEFDNVRLEH